MKTKVAWFVCVLLILLSFGSSIFLTSKMPDQMATHWNMEGQVDRYMDKTFSLYWLPVIQVAMLVILMVIPRMDPMKSNIAKFQSSYELFLTGFTGFMTYIHVLTLTWNLGAKMNFIAWLLPGMAGFMFLSGYLLSRAQQNYFIGIRTPWTLSNPVVWQDTHRLSGRAFKLAAIISMLGLIFQDQAFVLMIVPIILAAVVAVVYSYIRYTQLVER